MQLQTVSGCSGRGDSVRQKLIRDVDLTEMMGAVTLLRNHNDNISYNNDDDYMFPSWLYFQPWISFRVRFCFWRYKSKESNLLLSGNNGEMFQESRSGLNVTAQVEQTKQETRELTLSNWKRSQFYLSSTFYWRCLWAFKITESLEWFNFFIRT